MDTIQEELRNNHKIKIGVIIAFLVTMVIMFLGYANSLIYTALIFVDITNISKAFSLIIATLDFRILFTILPPIFLILGIAKYRKNVRYVKKYYSYKKLLEILKDEKFRLCSLFANKEEFFYSQNWLYIDEVLLPRFLIKEIKVEEGHFYNYINVILKSNEVYKYNTRSKGKPFLDMAKLIDEEFKKGKDVIEYFEPIEEKTIFKVLNKISLIFTFVGIGVFFLLKNLNLSFLSNDAYEIINMIALGMCGISLVENVVSFIKRQQTKDTTIAFILNLTLLLIISMLILCFRFMYIQSIV